MINEPTGVVEGEARGGKSNRDDFDLSHDKNPSSEVTSAMSKTGNKVVVAAGRKASFTP
jgi:hypothetical protein